MAGHDEHEDGPHREGPAVGRRWKLAAVAASAGLLVVAEEVWDSRACAALACALLLAVIVHTAATGWR
jgi:hypothetical protein